MELFSKQGVSVPVTTQMVWEAYKHVKQGGEAAGTDCMTWEYLHTHRSQLLYQLWIRLASGSYFPKAIKAVSILKKDGSKRVLGLPTLIDRIARASSTGSFREMFRTPFSSKLVWVKSRQEYA
jgi:RNA-directed DNA polymerase